MLTKRVHGMRLDMASLIILSLALAFTPLRIVGFILQIYVLGRLLPFRFSLIGRLLTAFLCIMMTTTAVAAFAWVVHLPLTSGLLLSMYGVSLLAALAVMARTGRDLAPLRWFDLNDVLSLAVTLATAAVLFAPVLATGHRNIEHLGPLVMYGGDNGAHIEILKANDFNRGYALGTHNTVNLPLVWDNYPMGWHIDGAFMKWLAESVVSVQHNSFRLTAFYYTYSAIWLCLLAFFMARTALMLFDEIRAGRKNPAGQWPKLLVPVVVAIGIAAWALPIFTSGFQPQLASLAIFIFQLLMLAEAYKREPGERSGLFVFAALAASAICLMWLFLAPVAIAVWVGSVLHTMWRRHSLRMPWYFWIGSGIIWLAACVQFYAQLFIPTVIGSIDADGYIPEHPLFFTLMGVLAAITLYAYLRPVSKSWRSLYTAALVAMLFMGVLGLHQMTKWQSLHYYYYKSAYTFILVAVVLLAAASSDLFRLAANSRPLWKWSRRVHVYLVLTFFLFAGVTAFWTYKSPEFDLMRHGGLIGFDPGYATVMNALVYKNSANGALIMPIGSCQLSDDVRARQFANGIDYTPQELSDLHISINQVSQDQKSVFDQLKAFAHTSHKDFYIVTRDQSMAQPLRNYLGADAKYMHVISIDPAPADTLKADCPGRFVPTPRVTPVLGS